MVKTVLLASLLLCSASLFAGPCLPGTLQNYIDLVSPCQAGARSFGGFELGPGAGFATPIDPALILVTPAGTFLAPTLFLTFNSSAGAGVVFESMFRFQAAGINLASALIGLSSPTATGDGAVTGVLDVCPDGSFLGIEPIGCPTSPATAIAFATAVDTQLRDSRNFTFSSFFDVFVDLTIDGGLQGSSTLPSASVTIGSVPEPGTLLLLACGLTVLGALHARRN